MRRLTIILVVVLAGLVGALTYAPSAHAGHCSYNGEAVLQQGSTLWGRGSFFCSSGTSVTATVCLDRWNGSSWVRYNCNTWSFSTTGGWDWGYSYASDCSASTAFRSAVNLYVHGGWQGYKTSFVHNC